MTESEGQGDIINSQGNAGCRSISLQHAQVHLPKWESTESCHSPSKAWVRHSTDFRRLQSNKHEEAITRDRDYMSYPTPLQPFPSSAMPYFVDRWNSKIFFDTSMEKNLTLGGNNFVGQYKRVSQHLDNREICESDWITFRCYSSLSFIRCRQMNKGVRQSTLEPTDVCWTFSNECFQNPSRNSATKVVPHSFSMTEQSSGINENSLPELSLVNERTQYFLFSNDPINAGKKFWRQWNSKETSKKADFSVCKASAKRKKDSFISHHQ